MINTKILEKAIWKPANLYMYKFVALLRIMLFLSENRLPNYAIIPGCPSKLMVRSIAEYTTPFGHRIWKN